MTKKTFYDQWYRIGNLRVGLRRSVLVRHHTFRKEPWYVYYDPAHNGFFRARPDTHEVIKHITPDRTLRDIWRDYVEAFPEKAPGQEDFFELIAALYRGNLLFVEGSVNEARLLERAVSKKHKSFMQNLSQILFFRLPLWDPEPYLERNKKIFDVIYSAPAVLCVAIVCLYAGYVFLLNADRAYAQSAHILQPNNWISLFIATFLTHILHEMSHAALCKHFGGHVRTMGVMFLMFAPLPYADVTASWSFRDTYKRAMVGAAGMYADLFSCALAALFWAYSPPGLANGIALNLMFVTAFYTFVFNVNPLMRFDGHYILSDLVAIPNLHKVAKSQFDTMFKHIILGDVIPVTEKVTWRRRLFLICFFVASFIYRNMVMIGIVLFVSDQYLGLGLIGAIAIAYSSFIMPLGKTLKPLTNKQFMTKYRKKMRPVLILIAGIVGFFIFVPIPETRRIEGVVEAVVKTALFVPVEGEIKYIPPRTGSIFSKGELLVQLENEDLLDFYDEIKAKLKSNAAREAQARSSDGAELSSIQQDRSTLQHQLQDIERQISQLEIFSEHSGVWVEGEKALKPGNWVQRGQALGALVDETSLKFLGILPQESSYGIAGLNANDATVRIEGLRNQKLKVTDLKIIPYSKKDLPSAALTPLAGGSATIEAEDPNAMQSVERFFLFTAKLDLKGTSGFDGRTGWMRISLPPRPIANQVWDRLRQFFQKRYTL